MKAHHEEVENLCLSDRVRAGRVALLKADGVKSLCDDMRLQILHTAHHLLKADGVKSLCDFVVRARSILPLVGGRR
ncbi:MAG: hypothetical protein C4334_03955 [Pyrinomonas sp.]